MRTRVIELWKNIQNSPVFPVNEDIRKKQQQQKRELRNKKMFCKQAEKWRVCFNITFSNPLVTKK